MLEDVRENAYIPLNFELKWSITLNMDSFHIYVVLRSRSHYSWVHFYSSEWKLLQMYILCSHLPQYKKKKPVITFL